MTEARLCSDAWGAIGSHQKSSRDEIWEKLGVLNLPSTATCCRIFIFKQTTGCVTQTLCIYIDILRGVQLGPAWLRPTEVHLRGSEVDRKCSCVRCLYHQIEAYQSPVDSYFRTSHFESSFRLLHFPLGAAYPTE